MATTVEVLKPFRAPMTQLGFEFGRGVFLLPLTVEAH